MYSRTYIAEEPGRINLPKNYDGTAFSEQEMNENRDTPMGVDEAVDEAVTVSQGNVNPWEREAEEPRKEDESREAGLFSSFSKSPLFGGLFSKGGLFSGFSGLKFPTIGTEEIILIAAAAYLFFSKEGDKECAIMLLLLLLIN